MVIFGTATVGFFCFNLLFSFFWAIPDSVQGLLLVLHPGIALGGLGGICGVPG